MRETGELYLGEDRPQRNAKTGRFLKGCTPYNKGKKWDECLSPESQEHCRRGWENLKTHRPKRHSPLAGNRPPREVIALNDEGQWRVLPSITKAAEWAGCATNTVWRCCRNNARHLKNTDYKCKGFRFYYETDDIWLSKV